MEKKALFNLIGQACQLDMDKTYFVTKDLHEAKYQFSINKCIGVDVNKYNGSLDFIEYSNERKIFKRTLKNTIQMRSAKH